MRRKMTLKTTEQNDVENNIITGIDKTIFEL